MCMGQLGGSAAVPRELKERPPSGERLRAEFGFAGALPLNLYVSPCTWRAFLPYFDTGLATSIAFLNSHALTPLLAYCRAWFTHAIRRTGRTDAVRVTRLSSAGGREKQT